MKMYFMMQHTNYLYFLPDRRCSFALHPKVRRERHIANMKNINELYAKSNGETIREHTDKLLKALEDFIEMYGKHFDEKVLSSIYYACEYHDYGKACYIVQKMLGNRNIPAIKKMEEFYVSLGFGKNVVPHGYLSPVFMNYKELELQLGKKLTRCLYTAVYYHHSRETNIDSQQIEAIVENDLSQRFDKCAVRYKQYLLNGKIDDADWVQYALIVGMLNKFDYYVSDAGEKLPVEIDGRSQQKYLADFVYQKFSEKGFALRPVQKYMWEHKNDSLIVTASTGIGKTEAALLWAGDSKLFYTLPLKVSINAMYKRIKFDYGYDKEKVTLLHSDCLSMLTVDDEFENAVIKYDASKRLSYPITVCTIDQLFSFVYKYRGSEILLATLKYSKIVIDEIQSYSPKIIAKLIYGLSLISKLGGKFAVITATLPPVLMYFIDQYMKIPHLPYETFLLTEQVRHKIYYEKGDDFDYEKIREIGKHKKVLIICNTVKRAVEVYTKLLNGDKEHQSRLIHAKFMKKHLRLLEEAIERFADSDSRETGIWISTQIVEASLDIDFDVLFTEMCTADSLLQRMGRCFRRRQYIEDIPNIYILDNRNGYGTVYQYKDIYDRSVEYLMKYQNAYFSEREKMEYVEQVYDTEALMKNNSKYFLDIENEIHFCENIFPFEIPKDEAKKMLREIISYKVIPEGEYNKNCDLLQESYEKLKKKKKYSFQERMEAMQILEDYSINLGNYDFRAEEKSNSIFSGLEYYTTNYKYDFDENTLCGKGLEYYKDGDNFI